MKTLLGLGTFLMASLLSLQATADEVQYLARGEQGLAARAQLIESAKQTIDFTYFIYEPCQPSTQLLVEQLARKVRQGVRVRLIVDAFLYDSDLKNNLTAEYRKLGMQVRFYNDGNKVNLLGQNMRSHIKYTVVDGKAYSTGGRNIADDYYGVLPGINFIDREVLVRGASAKQVEASFEELWNSSMVSERKVKAAFVPWNKQCEKDESGRVPGMKMFLKENQKAIMDDMPVRQCKNVTFLADSPDFGKMNSQDQRHRGEAPSEYMNELRLRKKQVTDGFVKFIKGSNSSFEFENWSYIPTGLVDQALAGLRKRNVTVFGITNSAADAPGLLGKEEVYLNAKYSKRDSVGSQFVIQMALGGGLDETYALTPGHSTFRLHGKVAVRDDKDVFVSSYNIDPRSYHTNLESAVVIRDCPGLADDLQAQFKRLRRIYKQDIENGVDTKPEDHDLLTKIVGFLGLQFM